MVLFRMHIKHKKEKEWCIDFFYDTCLENLNSNGSFTPQDFDSPNGGAFPLVKATNPRDLHMCLQLNLSTKSNTLNLKISLSIFLPRYS